MVVLGWNTIVLKQIEHKEMLCPICSHKGSVTFFLMCRVYHFFFIPVFPDNRYVYVVCRYCKEEINEVDVEKQYRILFKTKLYKEYVSLRAWSGSLIFLLIIIYYLFG